MPKLDLSFSANFLQQTSDLKLSGNLDFSLLSQISAGELRSLLKRFFEKIDMKQVPGHRRANRVFLELRHFIAHFFRTLHILQLKNNEVTATVSYQTSREQPVSTPPVWLKHSQDGIDFDVWKNVFWYNFWYKV